MHPNLKLLSASSLNLAHTCPRKFQLYRMAKGVDAEQEGQRHLDFGHWVGYGIQQLLIHENVDRAMFETFLFNKGDIFDDNSGAEKDAKTFWHALIGVEKFNSLRIGELQHYDLVVLDTGPAVEVGFILDCIGGFTYRGFIDGLLINRLTNELVVLECKTSKYKQVHDAQYRNSGQGLGYSLVVDAIAAKLRAQGREVASSWKVMYPIYLAGAMEWDIKWFHKSNAQRARWLMNLIIDIQHLSEFVEADYFPMHGESCFSFFRPCEYFELCEMKDSSLIGPIDKVPPLVDDESRYSFRFSMEELIAAQQAKLDEVDVTG